MNSTRVLYTAEAHVIGGRERGRARTADGNLELELRPPKELGGDGTGANPEQLFAMGWAACFESSMGLAAQRHGLRYEDVSDAAIDARVMLMPGERSFVLGAEFEVTLPSVNDSAVAAEVIRETHEICPYSNATRGNIDIAITVNGEHVEVGAVP